MFYHIIFATLLTSLSSGCIGFILSFTLTSFRIFEVTLFFSAFVLLNLSHHVLLRLLCCFHLVIIFTSFPCCCVFYFVLIFFQHLRLLHCCLVMSVTFVIYYILQLVDPFLVWFTSLLCFHDFVLVRLHLSFLSGCIFYIILIKNIFFRTLAFCFNQENNPHILFLLYISLSVGDTLKTIKKLQCYATHYL